MLLNMSRFSFYIKYSYILMYREINLNFINELINHLMGEYSVLLTSLMN